MREVPVSESPLGGSQPAIINSKKLKVLSFASIGNSFELYDFTLFGIMLPFIALKFFPYEKYSLLIGYLSFAITFLIAPFGSIFWGWYGDKFGRVALLRLSLMAMAIPSLCIALLPTHESIGIIAPILLIILRTVQGVSVSGEVIGAKIFAMEILGKKNFGLCSGIISGAGALGVLLAIAMAYITSQLIEARPDFWRVPFFIGSLLFFIARGIRIYLSKAFSAHNRNNAKITEIIPIIANNRHQSIIVFILGALLGVLSYSLHTFINPFLIAQGMDAELIYKYSIIGLISTAFFAILTGIFTDKYNKLIALNYAIIIAVMLGFYPLYLMLLQGGFYTPLSFILLEGLLGMYACASAIIMYRTFSPNNRCRGVMFNYASGCSIFGGLTPAALTSISSISIALPGLAVGLCALVSLLILRWSLKNATLF